MDINTLLAEYPQILSLPTFFLNASQGPGEASSIRLATTSGLGAAKPHFHEALPT